LGSLPFLKIDPKQKGASKNPGRFRESTSKKSVPAEGLGWAQSPPGVTGEGGKIQDRHIPEFLSFYIFVMDVHAYHGAKRG
jgi:hypothetical protein